MQDCASSNKIKENKYKILRMSLLLGRGENQEETLTNFEEAAREIDAMNDEIYQKDLEGKFYDTLTLEEEEKKLSILVDYIGGRVEQRISLLSDFSNVTGYDLMNLPPIKYYDKLDDYKERLKYIREYLNNTEEIKELDKKIEENEKKLKEAYLNKATAEEYNTRNEEILLNKFENILKTTNLSEVNETNIEQKLSSVDNAVLDSQKSLDIFNKSFATLSGSGISVEEEQEYKSYVENAKEVFYTNKEQQYLLEIYQYLLKNETEYNAILEKREKMNKILSERLSLRKELEVKDSDILNNLYDLLERQYEDIKHQKNNIETIDNLTDSIEKYKEKLNDLEIDNQKVEILALLREFCLIDTYTESPSLEQNNDAKEAPSMPEEPTPEEHPMTKKEDLIPEESHHTEIVSQENPSNTSDIFNIKLPEKAEEEPTKDNSPVEKHEDNEVISVETPTHIDLEYIHAKASKVMQRVGEMLGIKTKETKIVSVEEKKEVPKVEAPKIDFTEPKAKETTIPKETTNPLFNHDISSTNEEVVDPELNQDTSFWFSSDTPDALNELPDLEIANNPNDLFANSKMPELNFPNLNFGPNNDTSKEETK